MLKPLEQFICDTCGEIIEKPEDGWIEWDNNNTIGKNIDFNIVHNAGCSPRKELTRHGCYQHHDKYGRSDGALKSYINPNTTMAFVLSFMDMGSYHDPSGKNVAKVNLREYVEFVRRLTIPHYEEARIYWSDALSDGYFDGVNEYKIYSVDFLKGLIEEYSND